MSIGIIGGRVQEFVKTPYGRVEISARKVSPPQRQPVRRLLRSESHCLLQVEGNRGILPLSSQHMGQIETGHVELGIEVKRRLELALR